MMALGCHGLLGWDAQIAMALGSSNCGGAAGGRFKGWDPCILRRRSAEGSRVAGPQGEGCPAEFQAELALGGTRACGAQVSARKPILRVSSRSGRARPDGLSTAQTGFLAKVRSGSPHAAQAPNLGRPVPTELASAPRSRLRAGVLDTPCPAPSPHAQKNRSLMSPCRRQSPKSVCPSRRVLHEGLRIFAVIAPWFLTSRGNLLIYSTALSDHMFRDKAGRVHSQSSVAVGLRRGDGYCPDGHAALAPSRLGTPANRP